MADDTNAEGIPLRDYFAGQYMATAFEKAAFVSDYETGKMFGGRGGIRKEEIAAVLAYRYADAMISERKRHVANKGA